MMPARFKSGWWWFVLFKGANGWLAAVLAAFLAFTDGADWHSVPLQYTRLAMFCFLAGSKWIEGWLDQTFGWLSRPATSVPDTASDNGGAKVPEGTQVKGS